MTNLLQKTVVLFLVTLVTKFACNDDILQKTHRIYSDCRNFAFSSLLLIFCALMSACLDFVNIHNQYEINNHEHDQISSNSLLSDVDKKDDNELFFSKVDLTCDRVLAKFSAGSIISSPDMLNVLPEPVQNLSSISLKWWCVVITIDY